MIGVELLVVMSLSDCEKESMLLYDKCCKI